MRTDNMSDVTFSAPKTSSHRRTPLTLPAQPVCVIRSFWTCLVYIYIYIYIYLIGDGVSYTDPRKKEVIECCSISVSCLFGHYPLSNLIKSQRFRDWLYLPLQVMKGKGQKGGDPS
jgi:hypothetical protein